MREQDFKKSFDLAHIGGKTWDEFKAEADEQTKANATAWFGNYGEQREFWLKKLYDAAEEQAGKKKAIVPPPSKTSDKGEQKA